MQTATDWWALAIAPAGGPLTASATRQAGWQLVRDELTEAGPAGALAAGQGFVLTRAQALSLGYDASTIRRLVRRGEWSAPRRGVVSPLPMVRDGRPDGSAAELDIAAAALLRPHCVVSHQSAAALRGMSVLVAAPRVRLTTTSVTRAGGWPTCHVHAAGLPAEEIDSWHGVPVTTPARTAIDIARHHGVAAGLVAADSALAEGLLTVADLHTSSRLARRRPGRMRAERVVELARSGAESALESLTRLCLIDGGIADDVELQATIPTPRGTFRVDLLLRARSVIVEADGRVKYGNPDALWREKLRQEALERVGFRVVRVIWDDVTAHPAETVRRVKRALELGAPATAR